jgi:DNA mismatch repair protein MutS
VSKSEITPIRRQYLDVKKRYPHAIVFFRLGDFYETFDDDARLVARELGITLTSKPMGKNLRVPLAGVPYHSLDGHLARLLSRGYKVAICEQMEDPKASRGLVAREVVRLVTPGTVTDAALLPERANNYIACLVIEGESAGLAAADVSTGEFVACQLAADDLGAEISRLQPAEILVAEGQPRVLEGPLHTTLPAADMDSALGEQRLCEHFGVSSLAGFGCADLPLVAAAAGALLGYLKENQKTACGYLQPLRLSSTDERLALDGAAIRNLDILDNPDGRPSLVSTLDRTSTRMGGRLLRSWLTRPLLDVAALNARHDAVEAMYSLSLVRHAVQDVLKRLPDVERVTVRATAGTATPRELAALRDALAALPGLRAELDSTQTAPLAELGGRIRDHKELSAVLASGLSDEPPPALDQGDTIRPGFSAELDELRELAKHGRRLLAELETREREGTGIRNLKLGYNRVFGYYLEVSAANSSLVPSSWQRRQTLTGGERYITDELKELEERILSARERIETLERDLFRGLCATTAAHAQALLATAQVLAELDVYCAFAEVAVENGYLRPAINDSRRLEIREGRHPVVERALSDTRFVGNDLTLDPSSEQIVVLTGPNMAGKSTFLRQVALIVIMAQAGSFVPAAEAAIGIVDRVHARVGAQDDLAAGQSTFMVEMVETAAMLHQATPRSLLVFDEIGRGTSTYDGISIARSVVEHLHDRADGPRTLFATHYHELTELADSLERVRNYHVAVSEDGDEIVFLHKILPGKADRSYGIHVARLAGLPATTLRRAREILAQLEEPLKQGGQRNGHAAQLPLPVERSPLLDEIGSIDIDNLTPVQALLKLEDLRERARDGGR